LLEAGGIRARSEVPDGFEGSCAHAGASVAIGSDPTYLAALEARFAVAARHSRRVRFARIWVLVVEVVLVAVVLSSVPDWSSSRIAR